MDGIQNGIYGTHGSSTETHKSFSDTLQRMGQKDLKHILTWLYYNKCNEINIWHLDTQKHVSYEKWFNSTKKVTYDH